MNAVLNCLDRLPTFRGDGFNAVCAARLKLRSFPVDQWSADESEWYEYTGERIADWGSDVDFG
jgi:hypothetical protein